jgi:hypothetical protein
VPRHDKRPKQIATPSGRRFSKNWRYSSLSIGEFGRISLDGAQLELKFRQLGRQSELGPLLDRILAANTALIAIQHGPRQPDVERRHAKDFLSALTDLLTSAFELDRDGPPRKIDTAQLRADRPLAKSLAYLMQECTQRETWEEFLSKHPYACVLREDGPRIFARRNARRVDQKRLTTEILASIFRVSVQTVRAAMRPIGK